MADVIEAFEFEHNGRAFVASVVADEIGMGAPWENEDCHGPVVEASRDKLPGERIMCERMRNGGRKYLYDFAEAVAIAKRDGWGLSDDDKAALATKLGRVPTAGDIAHAAAEADFKRLRAWCNDDWCYVGVVVRLANACDHCGHTESLWGVESDAGDDYFREVARELVEQFPSTGR